ncbi:DUF924 family protein [Listeria sp. PSOL-1]|uniref:DUF924 family protein n=1 Tax=Listeria sp. PSOL-1 TaxID=1844999 RepID=UPI0013D4DD3A|nr:DUF924 family protein [Listeria sp. PSOL-1]
MYYQEVIDFWFKESTPDEWFTKNKSFDELIRKRFLKVHKQVIKGEKVDWRLAIQGRLAEIIVLDQFSRNLYRDDPRSFAYDGMALILAQEAILHYPIEQLSVEERSFLYMPLMHSESLLIHEEAVKCFSEKGMEKNLQFEQQHRDILVKFGRYPHRNKIVGRASTEEELAFLQTPGSAF